MNRLYVIALLAVGLMSIAAVFLVPAAAPAPAPVLSGKPAREAEDRVLTLTRDGSGQFTLRAGVNGTDVEFLVDTGADLVALTEAEAEELGLMVSPEDFQPTMQTASGVGYGAPVILDEVEIGGRTLHDVDAVVVKDLGTNLLGQSVLRQLGSVELKGDKMTIKAH